MSTFEDVTAFLSSDEKLKHTLKWLNLWHVEDLMFFVVALYESDVIHASWGIKTWTKINFTEFGTKGSFILESKMSYCLESKVAFRSVPTLVQKNETKTNSKYSSGYWNKGRSRKVRRSL